METYKLPKHLIGSETARGAVPARLTPIFRDREELSAGDSLSGQVQDALSASDALIVLCSPNAKGSAWVSKEIETFRALHPDRPILAALLEGEPDEAFPGALTVGGAEPIAADLRKGKDGWRLGQQKLIAGMTGVPLDTLVQRDAQRQLRRVTAITVGALIAMLVMALLLVAALRARAEADRQRTEAEGLVEYMLTDLRDRLKGVGRLDVMTAVNERAMGYYGKQGDLASLPPESLNRRARILHAMGEDDEKRGDLGLALKKFEEAHRATAAVLAQKPEDADAIFAHAQSEYWVGYGHEKQGSFDAALKHNREYGRLARRFAEHSPDHRRGQKEIGWSENTIGAVLLNGLNAPAKAEPHFLQYAETFQTLLAENPNDSEVRHSLSDAHGWLADTALARNNFPLALKHRNSQLSQLRRLLSDDPQSRERRLRLAMSLRNTARVCKKMSDLPCARKNVDLALAQLDSRFGYDPKNDEWRVEAIYAFLDSGFYSVGQNRPDQATQDLMAARRLLNETPSTSRDLSKYQEISSTAAVLQSQINDNKAE